MSINTQEFGFSALLFTLKNANGVTLQLTNYGGAIVRLLVPDKNGVFEDVVLGYDTLDGYIHGTSNQGALIGRYGNRIRAGQFTLNGKDYQLACNDNGINHLHGGNIGYNKRLWAVTACKNDDAEPSVTFAYTDPDGEENFPGTLQVKVCYTLTDTNAVKIDYSAETDQDTLVNLTNHTYFNLKGYGSPTITDHFLQINASFYTPTDDALIPTGECKAVKGTAFDFTATKEIGKDLDADDRDLQLGGGYDHNFILGEPNVMKEAALVYEPTSGRKMQVFTNQPAIQFYIGNFLDGKEIGKKGIPLTRRSGFCLETQFSPDTPNLPNFPSCVLHPNETYSYTTIYQFSL